MNVKHLEQFGLPFRGGRLTLHLFAELAYLGGLIKSQAEERYFAIAQQAYMGEITMERAGDVLGTFLERLLGDEFTKLWPTNQTKKGNTNESR